MRITADTNVLVRSAVRDDVQQADRANKALTRATLIAVPLPCLCEFVWVLRQAYGYSTADIALAIQALMHTDKVVMNRPAVEQGLAMLMAGGDFADGAMAYEGSWLGGERFVSFDQQAVKLLKAQGKVAQLL